MKGEATRRDNRNEEGDGIVTLLKETVDGFGRLISDHIKLARLELFADAKSYGRRAATLALLIPFLLLGYAFVCLGLAVVLSPWLGLGGALFLVGGVHLIGAATAVSIVVRKMRSVDLMQETAYEMNRSVSTLTARMTNGSVPAAAAPERTPSGARVNTVLAQGGPRLAKSQL